MSTNVEHPPEKTAASLVSGILGDLQQLIEQQFQLTRREIDEEIRHRAAASAVFALGIGILFLNGIMLCLTGTYFLHWVTSPIGTDSASIPLWGCHAAVAVVLTILGGVVTQIGRARFNSIERCRNPVSEILREERP